MDMQPGPDVAPTSEQPVVTPIPPSSEATLPNLNSMVKPPETGAKPMTRLLETTQQLMSAAANDPKLQEATLRAFERTAGDLMRASVQSKEES